MAPCPVAPGRARGDRAVALVFALALLACSTKHEKASDDAPSLVSASTAHSVEPAPRVLYLPDAEAPPEPRRVEPAPLPVAGPCPPEMVAVRGAFCIDRFEATLVDAATGRRLSPYYHPTPDATRREYERWQHRRDEARTPLGRTMPIPAPPEWQLEAETFAPLATSVPDSIPSGYLSGEIAERACRRAGKRLCTVEEWVTACRGSQNRPFPYGHLYEDGKCNVYRGTHPAGLLHGNPSDGHLDPRLNAVSEEDGQPLLHPTGATPSCRSEWGADAVHDMVGNLDEWVDDPEGTFVGGFYARNTSRGCDARVEVHSFDYYDYSLGARCCKTP